MRKYFGLGKLILVVFFLVLLSACENKKDWKHMFVFPIDSENVHIFEGHPDISGSLNGVFLSTSNFEDAEELFGKQIYAADDGVVTKAITSYKAGQGYGQYLILSHDDGWETLYGHCSKINVIEGNKVKKGDVIAEIGGTGKTSHIGCYFEIRKNSLSVKTSDFIGN